ncbi:cell division protein ZipA C-terminal FtsZ-binding domain-containing protein [Ramlibacter algicola]|uniref:Cell division protein ZipA n=1 Tax=Ramlibacter algicola TaxID=2795217 RepID=A0A934UR40_9BURK|nr:cell division protein ZipA C-terminal FtsZ-binding domain-containing protein [Ramlibacter algicola]MBK0393339.1 cell division protein FtsZ [Ramlibacter algicola]
MSTFTLGLGILGGVVLAGVVGWNAWTTRKLTPRQAEAPTPRDDAHADTGPVEPSFDGPLGDDSVPPLPQPERKPGLDALIDAIAPIAVDTLVSGEAALAALPATRRAGSKPFAIEGHDERTQHWETPQAGRRYNAFQAGVQLANRMGALNEIEYSEFVVKAQAFADAIGGSPEFPEMLEEVARARELDQFAGGHDAQLGFTLRARSAAWSPGYVQQNAAKLGFIAGAIPGRMVLPASQQGQPPLLVLSFDTQAALAEDPTQAAIRDITLSLDVPQVHRGEQPFLRMREAAVALATSMDGVLTDDAGQLIRDEGLDVIGADLEQLYDTLEARDLAAGSPQARRLFS